VNPSAFSRHFLKSLQTVNVADLEKRFHWEQPPEVEKILAQAELGMATGMSPRDDEGNRDENLILAGDSNGVDRKIQKEWRKTSGGRVGPSGVDPLRFLSDEPKHYRIKISLKFGTDKKGRRARVKRMLCSTHGKQKVISHTRQTFVLECGCSRKRDIKS
jgi:hypothetical protein